MSRLFLISGEFLLITWGVRHLLQAGWSRAKSKKLKDDRPISPISIDEIYSFCKRFGRNSNSFMVLYPGFEYFSSTNPEIQGLIAYVDTTHAWVAAAEPLADHPDQLKLLEEFAEAAAKQGKRTLLIPADQDFAERAEKCGFQAVLVGSEPLFSLDRYPPNGNWNEGVTVAKYLAAKGAKVREFRSEELSNTQRAGLDQITQEWLQSRKTAALGFLNQVNPWLHSDKKKYFLIELGNKVLAFVVAIPTPARNRWYLIDTLRKGDSPSGTTELLMLEAMKALKQQGADEITLGVSPLSKIDAAQGITIAQPKQHRVIYAILNWIFENGNLFYNFKPLFQYKIKFQPTALNPVFLLYRGINQNPSLSIKDLLSISQAWFPHGISHSVGSGVIRLLSKFSLSDFIKSQLLETTVVRSAPPSWPRLLYRCRFTVALLLINTFVYFVTSDRSGILNSEIAQRWGFSWKLFLQHPLQALALSPFLHWNPGHLLLNLLCMTAFTGGLEYLAGTFITFVCYFIPTLVGNPLIFFICAEGLKQVIPSIDVSGSDVGASLGIFGCAGALYWFLKNGKFWILTFALMALATILPGPYSQGWITLDHWISLGLGILLGKVLLRA